MTDEIEFLLKLIGFGVLVMTAILIASFVIAVLYLPPLP